VSPITPLRIDLSEQFSLNWYHRPEQLLVSASPVMTSPPQSYASLRMWWSWVFVPFLPYQLAPSRRWWTSVVRWCLPSLQSTT